MQTESRREELEQIQNELDVEIIPGTEVMADLGSHHAVNSDDSPHRFLVPQPSDDPHDPLNWTVAWKLSALTAVSTMSFTQGFAPLALGPMFGYLMKDYNRSLADVIQFTGVTILVLGFSNFLWVPISTSFGRRPVLIASQVVCLASHIWRAKATTYDSFMGAAILSGIGAGPGETIQPSIIADIFFLHDRGKWNTMYWVLYTGALIVAPIVAGAMADHDGWPSFWWLNAAMTGCSLVAIVFGFPETMFSRVETFAGELPRPKASSKVTEILRDKGSSNACLGKGTPSRQQWWPYQPNPSPFRSIMRDLWIPWKLFSFPIVLFASFVVSWSCSFILILNLTQTQVFSAPPYNLSSQSIGFLNFSLLVGALIGLATAGPFSDWVSARATRRNHGIREPEMRLPAMVPYVLLMAFGHIITAIGYQRKWPWHVIVILGYTCAGIQVAGLPSISSTYAVDSYKPVAGSLFVAITVNKNLWGYGMGRFITPWTEERGFIEAFMVNMALTFAWCLFGVIFYYYGKTFRRWTKDSIIHRL
ncbi:major facilitator superfamily domain-containing protein [Hirsutella rhossiliensis]|uniref:Major facilitator superfamily domain-containing protein n=1 Tax=Hirsutella rhossiliensis TaxID=111463 RepID=A0A9P8SFP0_9HYPO|nr:major facilitator superfamily domain-containing protein [Hirsutella rhossiliensis]KAH0960244.1 major facilitator superfamily domain-containing protein [Hirsutella rhossiliensis]